MENIEERLRRLEAADCKVCGFTVDNADPGFQDRLLNILPALPVLRELCLFNINLSEEQCAALPEGLKLLT